jgi:hypothetical protein
MEEKIVIYRLLLLTLFCGLGLASGDTVYIPQFGHGAGFQTSLTFMNFSSTTNRLEVRTYAEDGTPANLLLRPESPFEQMAAVDTIGVEVAGYGTTSAESYSEDLNAVTVGYAEIDSDFSEGFAVEAVFRRFSDTDVLLTTTSVLPNPAMMQFSFFAFIDSFSRSGVALMNPDLENAATVNMKLLDRFGILVAELDVSLAAGAKIARFLDEDPLFDAYFQSIAGQDFTGSVEVSADRPVAITVIKTEGSEGFFTTQTIQSAREID